MRIDLDVTGAEADAPDARSREQLDALVLGLPNRYYVVTTAIYQLVQQYPPKIQTAAAMGVSLFAVMFVAVLAVMLAASASLGLDVIHRDWGGVADLQQIADRHRFPLGCVEVGERDAVHAGNARHAGKTR